MDIESGGTVKDVLTIEPNVSWREYVPEIDTEDPVLGGKDGIVNRPHQVLAERTEWLKNNTPTLAAFDDHASQSAVHHATPSAVASRIIMRDKDGRAQINEPLDPADIANKGYVDRIGSALGDTASASEDISKHVAAHAVHGATHLPTPSRIATRDAGGRTQVAAPVEALDAANKGYVDQLTPPAAPDAPGIVQLATQAEVIEGTDGAKVVTPATLQGKTASAATASRLVMRDENGKAQGATPTSSDPNTTYATKEYVDRRSGGMFNRRLVITSSRSQPDPSNGASPAFMITCVGGGCRGFTTTNNAGDMSNYYYGGGGATAIAILPKSAIAWPVQITVGAVQGTTSFGSYLAAEGATDSSGAGSGKLNSPLTLYPAGTSTALHNLYPAEARTTGSGGNVPTLVNIPNVSKMGIGAIASPYYAYYTGESGLNGSATKGPGRSFAYYAGLGNYGSGGLQNASGTSVAATGGVCIIDYYDPAY
jgi:hypothetical protein